MTATKESTDVVSAQNTEQIETYLSMYKVIALMIVANNKNPTKFPIH